MVTGSSQMIIRPGPLGLAINVGNEQRLLFDGRGRVVSAVWDGATYRRSLDNLVTVRQLSGAQVGTRTLSAVERDGFYAELQRQLLVVRAAAAGGWADVQAPWSREDALRWIDHALAWEPAALEAEAAAFRQAYPVPQILPPDQSLAVALHVATTCTPAVAGPRSRQAVFPKVGDELQRHVAAVQRLVGDDPLRRGVFLADQGALRLPLPMFRNIVAVARAAFPAALSGPRGGIYAHLHPEDTDPGELAWGELAALGLRRVYLQVEPGNLAVVSKHIAAVHAAGVTVGALVTAGVELDLPSALATSAVVRLLGLTDRDTLFVAATALYRANRAQDEACPQHLAPRPAAGWSSFRH